MNEDTTQQFPKHAFEIILARLDSIDSSLGSRMDSLEARMTALEEKVDSWLIETRPIREKGACSPGVRRVAARVRRVAA